MRSPRVRRRARRCDWRKVRFDLTASTDSLIPESEDESSRPVAEETKPAEFEISDETLRVINAMRDGYRSVERRGESLNEAETRQLLIAPVLDALGFPPSHRRPEDGDRGNRPDELCYDRVVQPDIGEAAIILEAKSLNSEFDIPEQLGRRASSPDRQIQRYLRQHIASGPATLGILTDGVRWRLYERSGSDIAFIADYNFTPMARQFWRSATSFDAKTIEQFDAFITIATRCFEKPAPLVFAPGADPVIELLKIVSAGGTPTEILAHVVENEEIEPLYEIDDHVALTGLLEDTFQHDWEDHVYVIEPDVAPEGQLSLSDQLTVGVVKFKHSEFGLGRGDTAASARILARAAGSNMSVLLIYSEGTDGSFETRLAACADGRVNMTAAFDPELPLPSARTAIGGIIAKLASTKPLDADDILGPLEVMPLRQQFYREVSAWTWNQQREQSLAYRQSVLKHLIRVIFAWILKEESMIPHELFEYAYAVTHLDSPNDYHRDVLSYLFHERLNTIEQHRIGHSTESLNVVLNQAPFLNGSLFAKDDVDIDLRLRAARYWSTDESKLGLFTIFSRYHWTTDEHRPSESEQTLDPELLSNLFEQLITPTEEGNEPPRRQLRGTYYTPPEVADEMVIDALTAALKQHAPDNITQYQLLELFGNADAEPPDFDQDEKSRLANHLKSLRIFDPAVGSGAFLFSCLVALKSAIYKLNGRDNDVTREIIKNQLAGQDINALATQITRLRLFIAIKSAEKEGLSQAPLPNLEATIVCADTLETVANPDWLPHRPGTLGEYEPRFAVALDELAQIRQRWFDAHSEEEKTELSAADSALRTRLSQYLDDNGEGVMLSPEVRGFVDFHLLNTGVASARTDARMLFYAQGSDGFDIVIGNPPYEKLEDSVNQRRRTVLVENKEYKTVNCNNLYTLFCEVALALAKRDGGVVTMVVPLTIAFGQKERTLRKLFARLCGYMDTRYYDNIPDTIFNGTPLLKTWKNRQRTAIFTAIKDSTNSTIFKTTGLQGWLAADRKACISNRAVNVLPEMSAHENWRIVDQWPRIPTQLTARLINEVIGQKKRIVDFETGDGTTPTFPKIAYQFIGTVPEGSVKPRNEIHLTVADENILRLVMAALNGHIAYAW